MSVILGNPYILSRILVFRHRNRDIIRQVATTYYGGTGVNSHLPYTALQFLCIMEDFLVQFSTIVQLLYELRDKTVTILQRYLSVFILHSALERLHHLYLVFRIIGIILFHFHFDNLETRLQLIQLRVEGIFLHNPLAEAVRNHLGQTVALVDAEVGYSGNILDGALGRHRTESYHA